MDARTNEKDDGQIVKAYMLFKQVENSDQQLVFPIL
jgi:hypothetical protein